MLAVRGRFCGFRCVPSDDCRSGAEHGETNSAICACAAPVAAPLYDILVVSFRSQNYFALASSRRSNATDSCCACATSLLRTGPNASMSSLSMPPAREDIDRKM